MKHPLLILLLTISLAVQSQNNMVYRQQHLHEVLSNPAAAGSAYYPVLASSYMKQWLGISNSPYTMLASANYRIGSYDFYNPKMMLNRSNMSSKEHVGLGIGLYGDRNGPLTSRGLNLAYAYHLHLTDAHLGLGIAATMEQSILDGSYWDPTETGDPILDPDRQSFFEFNTNLGLVLASKNYYAGFAINHLLPLTDKKTNEAIKQDYLLYGSYIIRQSNSLKFEPGVNLRYLDYENFEFDIRLKVYIGHVNWVALTYRSYQALALTAGIKLGKIYLAYQFESNLSSLAHYNLGSHGFHLGYNLGVRGLDIY